MAEGRNAAEQVRRWLGAEDRQPEKPVEAEGTGAAAEATSLPAGIAFASEQDERMALCTIDPDGGDLARVALVAGERTRMDFSPNGGKVVFNSKRDGNWEVYVMDTAGTNLVRLTHHPADDLSPAWSPDGSKIAWQSKRSGTLQIHAMNSDGTDQTQLTHVSWSYEPFWSPDGSKIGFTSHRDGYFEIYVMNADGTNPARLTHSRGRDFGADWSPDGSKILFMSNRDTGATRIGGETEIYVMNADGTKQTRLTEHPRADLSAVWSPDGEAIAFVSDRDGDREIYVMTADGANEVNITNSPEAQDNYPAWLPDQ